MSWMTPAVLPRGDAVLPGDTPDPDGPRPPRSADMRSLRCLAALLLLVPEQLLDPAPPPLQPVERKAEVGDRVADRVVRSVVLEPDEQRPLVRPGLEAALPQLGEQQVG